MVYIVDSIMGSGKTSAAIQYMNEHASERFLYITPFIDETERIRESCPTLQFWTPSNQLSEYEFRKCNHLKALVEQGRNVSMTHSLFMMSDAETAQMITSRGYTIIIDEVIEVFRALEVSDDDINTLISSGLLVGKGRGENTDFEYYEPNEDKQYHGGRFSDLFVLARSRRLVNIREEGSGQKFYFWTLHKQLFTMSDKIFVLTYLFDGMPMKAFLDMNGIEYSRMSAGKDGNGVYRFLNDPSYPEYVYSLKEKIHVCSDARLNAIGASRTALSATWTKNAVNKTSDGRADKLRRSINTFFRNHCPAEIKADRRLWCTYKEAVRKVKDKGFSTNHLAWNCRATNKYQHCVAMAYCVNVFINPNALSYFSSNNVSVDVDKYALANMVQWIYRGAIRCGGEIWLYVPSSRMRTLLVNWIDEVSSAPRT